MQRDRAFVGLRQQPASFLSRCLAERRRSPESSGAEPAGRPPRLIPLRVPRTTYLSPRREPPKRLTLDEVMTDDFGDLSMNDSRAPIRASLHGQQSPCIRYRGARASTTWRVFSAVRRSTAPLHPAWRDAQAPFMARSHRAEGKQGET